jgi:hypothetical protein
MMLVGSGGIWWDLVESGGIWWDLVGSGWDLVESFDSTATPKLPRVAVYRWKSVESTKINCREAAQPPTAPYRRPCGLLLASCSGMKWPCSGPNAPSALSSTSNRRSSACRTQGTYCGGWRRCACLDANTRGLVVGALASTTCNNFIADLLFLSEVSHSLLVAAPPACVHPYLGKWALVPPRSWVP